MYFTYPTPTFLISVAKFTLKSEFIEVAEDVGYVNVCVILKSCIKRDVLIHVNFYNDSAFGELIIITLICG